MSSLQFEWTVVMHVVQFKWTDVMHEAWSISKECAVIRLNLAQHFASEFALCTVSPFAERVSISSPNMRALWRITLLDAASIVRPLISTHYMRTWIRRVKAMNSFSRPRLFPQIEETQQHNTNANPTTF